MEHQPNACSGGRTSRTDIGQFLRAGGRGPEHQALLALIGTLVEIDALLELGTMFFLFSNRLGCRGSLLISALVTVALLFLFGMLRF